MVRLYTFLISFIILACASVAAQDVDNATGEAVKDSILDKITNIDEQIHHRIAVEPTSISKLTINKDSLPKIGVNIDSIITNIEFPLFKINKAERRIAQIKTIDKDNWIPFDNTVTFADTIIIDPLFLPVVFDPQMFNRDIDFLAESKRKQNDEYKISYSLIGKDKTLAPMVEKNTQVEDTRIGYFSNSTEYVKLSARLFETMPTIEVSIGRDHLKKELLPKVGNTVAITPIAKPQEIKKNKWMFTGEHRMNINQATFSENFHSKADNYYNVENYHKIISKYRYKKISFENTTEWRLNFQNSQGDTVHTLGITDDYLRTFSVLKLDAFLKGWAYSLSVDAKTPVFNSFFVNRPVTGKKGDRKSSLFSPFEMTVGGGVTYGLERTSKKDKHRKLNLSVNISPISINFKCVRDDLVDETRFGIRKGGDSNTDLGSTVNANMTYSFNRNARLVTRLHYFSNFERAFSELENTFTYQLTNALSTSLYMYWRFDDSVGVKRKDEGLGYFQYQQRTGLGLSYRW